MKNETVLVIDDDRFMRNNLAFLLEEKGFVVDCCDGGPSALDRLKVMKFDIILIDYRMPEMNGAKVTRLLRSFCPDAFIVGMSIEDESEVFDKAGANVFINKSALVHELVLSIKNRSHLGEDS